MKSIQGGVKNYSIQLVKDAIVFIDGDSNDNWERFANVPLIYNGTHAGTGQLMFETPHEGTIYLAAPIISCIIPPEYKDHLLDVFDDEFTDIDLVEDDEHTTHDLSAHRARVTSTGVSISSVFRAAADDLDNGKFGPKVTGAIVVVATEETCVHRPIGLSIPEITHAFEYCKQTNMEMCVYGETDDLEDH